MITIADDNDNWTASATPVLTGSFSVSPPPPGPHDAENARAREQQAVLHTARLYTSTKTYAGFPCAHRQWRHPGHCAFVHGYSRSFHFVFGCRELDECGFVVDFGALQWLKDDLETLYDHTLLINKDDPLLPWFREVEERGGCTLVTPAYGVGMEGSARLVCELADLGLQEKYAGRCWVVSVECRENEKNSAIYRNPNAGAHHGR